MDLIIKNIAAVAIMTAIHYISKTKNFYISGLALSFPGLSILAYYFMFMEDGSEKVRVTTSFAMLAVIPFVIFLIVLNITMKKDNIALSIISSGGAWIFLSFLLIFVWQRLH